MVELLFWCAVGCCAIAQVAILRSALAAHDSPDTGGVPRPRRPGEIAWAALPALGLAVLLLFTWRAIRAHSDHATPLGVVSVRTTR